MKENFTSKKNAITNNLSEKQISTKNEMLSLFEKTPVPKEEVLDTLHLYTGRQSLQRLLFLNQIYQEIVNTHGVIMEFGVRWGANIANLIYLRSIYEPYNPTRKIIGFDTFEGFPSISEKDGNAISIKVGSHTVTDDYEDYLDKVLTAIERDAPIEQIKKFQLIKGDATKTVEKYLNDNQETLISLAYFDFDIYAPTKSVLKTIKERIVRGGVIAFDELNYHRYPGETIAFMEELGANKFNLIRTPNSGTVSYLKYE